MFKCIVILVFLATVFSCSKRPMAAVSDNCKDLPQLNWQSESRSSSASPKLAVKLIAAAKSDSALLMKALKTPKGEISIESNFSKEVKKYVENKSEVSQEFWQQDIVYRQSLCFLESQRDKVGEPIKAQLNSLILELVRLRAINSLSADNVKKKTELKEK